MPARPHEERAREIVSALAKDNSEWRDHTNASEGSDWFDETVTQLLLLLGDEDLAYLNTSLQASVLDGDEFLYEIAARIYVFTKTRLIEVRTSGLSNAALPTSTVVARRSLEKLTLTGGGRAFDPSDENGREPMFPSEWPKPFEIELDYPNRDRVVLAAHPRRPPQATPESERLVALRGLLPSLAEDLAG